MAPRVPFPFYPWLPLPGQRPGVQKAERLHGVIHPCELDCVRPGTKAEPIWLVGREGSLSFFDPMHPNPHTTTLCPTLSSDHPFPHSNYD